MEVSQVGLLRLSPFLTAVIIYFAVWPFLGSPSIINVIIKCCPILLLIYFVGSQGISFEEQHDYQRSVIIAMVFSCVGDAFLVWKDSQFIEGMVAFAIAHTAYIHALGFSRPLHWLRAIPFACVHLATMYLFYPGLKGILLPGVCIYILLIACMGWRACANVDFNHLSCTSLCAFIGALFFMLSDLIIGIEQFVYPIPTARLIIMPAYYSAQVLLAVSAVNKDSAKSTVKIS